MLSFCIKNVISTSDAEPFFFFFDRYQVHFFIFRFVDDDSLFPPLYQFILHLKWIGVFWLQKMCETIMWNNNVMKMSRKCNKIWRKCHTIIMKCVGRKCGTNVRKCHENVTKYNKSWRKCYTIITKCVDRKCDVNVTSKNSQKCYKVMCEMKNHIERNMMKCHENITFWKISG